MTFSEVYFDLFLNIYVSGPIEYYKNEQNFHPTKFYALSGYIERSKRIFFSREFPPLFIERYPAPEISFLMYPARNENISVTVLIFKSNPARRRARGVRNYIKSVHLAILRGVNGTQRNKANGSSAPFLHLYSCILYCSYKRIVSTFEHLILMLRKS